jgi:UDP-N-acetylmuramate--alanine ligase
VGERDGRMAPGKQAVRPSAYVARPGTIPTLEVPDASGWRHVHLVGIGGPGMRNVARLLIGRGVRVSGSDLKDSPGLQSLADAGAEVFVGHRSDQLAGPPDAVVTTGPVPATNPELVRARELGVPVFARAQVLAALARGHRVIAVAGTAGKTTTTSMITSILDAAGLSPTYVIGGDLNESGSGAAVGTGDLFVVEADESDGMFLLLRPDVAVVTNIERDHVDFYADLEETHAAFTAFADQAQTLVACWDDPGVRAALAWHPGRTVRYGAHDDVDLRITDIVANPSDARARFLVGERAVDVQLTLPGIKNLWNGAAAVGAAAAVGVDPGVAAGALAGFTGVRRRFEVHGDAAGATFVDDYAHNPTKVAVALEIARDYPHRGRLIAVCQPHRYTRMSALSRELGESLVGADMAVITEIYDAHEQPIPGVTGKLVVNALSEAAPGKRVVYMPRRTELIEFLAREVRDGDLVVTLSCGDINQIIAPVMARVEELQAARA